MRNGFNLAKGGKEINDENHVLITLFVPVAWISTLHTGQRAPGYLWAPH